MLGVGMEEGKIPERNVQFLSQPNVNIVHMCKDREERKE
jgi:hypothetical protein